MAKAEFCEFNLSRSNKKKPVGAGSRAQVITATT